MRRRRNYKGECYRLFPQDGRLTLHTRYHGYNKDLIDRFVAMGFGLEDVVEAFEYVGIDKMDGQDYELEDAYMGDITARLFGEA